jgi:hypothetical protein
MLKDEIKKGVKIVGLFDLISKGADAPERRLGGAEGHGRLPALQRALDEGRAANT